MSDLIDPANVPPEDARRILDFLNTATAAEIDARIDLPNEADVGPRLAANIAAHRQEIGTFQSLDQLLSVRLIGPVRFTQIVRALRGEAPQEGLETLADAVRALQAKLDALGGAAAPPRVELRLVEAQRYLGQPATVTGTVTGPDGRRLGGAPVTVTTAWGRLRASDGFSVQEGSSVTLRTADDGTFRASLQAPTSEDLQATQQASIELHLQQLDPAAATPRDALDAVTALVRAYRFEANDTFRDGVDIYFREFHGRLLDGVNYRDELDAWSTIDAAVVAYVQDEDATPVRASAALVIRFRDWLRPWVQVHVTTTSDESLLGGELTLAPNLGASDDVLSRIHERVGTYVSLQRGVVGQLVAQHVASSKVDDFLSTGIDALAPAAQQAVFPAARSAATTVGKLGAGALTALAETRDGVRTSVAADIDGAVQRSSVIAGLQEQVAAKADKTALDSALASKLSITDLNDKLKAASTFDAFKTSLSTSLDLILIQPPRRIFGP